MKKMMIGLIGAMCVSQADAVTIHSSLTGNIDWNSAIWGDPAAVPTNLYDYVHDGSTTAILLGLGDYGSFEGNSLTLQTGGKWYVKGSGVPVAGGTLDLDGGQIWTTTPSTPTISGDIRVLSESYLYLWTAGLNFTPSLTAQNGSALTMANYYSASWPSPALVINTTNEFDGTFKINDTPNGDQAWSITFSRNYTNATLYVSGNQNNAARAAIYQLTGDVFFKDVSMPDGSGGLVSLSPGTYDGAALLAAGVSGSYFNDLGGTISAGVAVPTAAIHINPSTPTGTNIGWNDAIWGDPAAVPTNLYDYIYDKSGVWLNALGATYGSFEGNSLTVSAGVFLRGGGDLGGHFYLDSGQLQNRSGINAVILGDITVESRSDILNISGNLELQTSLNGAGQLDISAWVTDGQKVVINSADLGYTGTFYLDNAAADNVYLSVQFDQSYTNAALTFKGGDALRLPVVQLTNDITFQTVGMPSADDLSVMVDLTPGVYDGAALLAAGIHSNCFADLGGTLRVGNSGGEVILDPLFMDHMVLQRNETIPVFGTATTGATVTVTFNGQSKSAVSSESGEWQVFLDPMAASAVPQELTVSAFDGLASDHVADVLVGDVWLCGGQSNMDTPLSDYEFVEPDFDGFTNALLRLFNVNFDPAASPQNDVSGETVFSSSWLAAGSQSIPSFSAVGMCFGRRLQQESGVPIGLIESAVGGSQIEPWIPAETLEAMGLSSLQAPADRGVNPRQQPSVFYNGMIHALRRLPLKGAIWYQGESNANNPSIVRYDQLFEGLIGSWRDRFAQPELPFYFVQLAPYGLLGWDSSGEAWAWLRARQETALSLPNTGRAVTTDLGEYSNIHPENKKPVGERLADLALRDMSLLNTPGFPRYQRKRVYGNRVQVDLSNFGSGLKTVCVAMNKNKDIAPGTDPEAYVVETNTLAGFTICGPDREFVSASASIIDDDTVEVWSDSVDFPAAVRYGWSYFPLCNLANSDGLPASPFRTDGFPMPVFKAPFLESVAADGALTGAVECVVHERPDESLLVPETIEGREALRMSYVATALRMAYFKADDDSLRNGNRLNQSIAVDYLDDGPGTIEIKYDAVSGAWKSAGLVEMMGSGQWRRAIVELNDAWFAGRCNGADIRLEAARNVYFSGVYTITNGNASVSMNGGTTTGINVGWNDAVWGDPAAVPANGSDYVYNKEGVWLNALGTTYGSFAGDSLTIQAGAALFGRGGGSLGGTLILNGGQFQNRSGGAVITGNIQVASESKILNVSGNLDLQTGLSGSGRLNIGAYTTDGQLVAIGGTDAGFSGGFRLDNADADNVYLSVRFDQSYTNAALTFEGGNALRLPVLQLTNNIIFQSVSMPSADDLSVMVDLDPGVYDGAALLAAGVSSNCFSDWGGTLTAQPSGSEFQVWAAGWKGALGSEFDDYDGDGIKNIGEYAFGGDPADALDTGVAPFLIHHNGQLKYIHFWRNDSNLLYRLESTDDLVGGLWTNTDYVVAGSPSQGSEIFCCVTNTIPADKDQTFLRMTVEIF